MSELHFDGALFDLDGVVTRTALVHARAWKALFDELLAWREAHGEGGFSPFDSDRDYRAYVDGKPRIAGVQSFLSSRGIDLPQGRPDDAWPKQTLRALGNRKNELFLQILAATGVETYSAALRLITELRRCEVPTAVVSSSKNCEHVLQAAHIAHLFDVRVDGVTATELGLSGKPSPDAYLEAARRLQVAPRAATVFEDAVAGVAAASAGAFGLVVGLERDHYASELRKAGAHIVVRDLNVLTPQILDDWFVHQEDVRPSALAHWRDIQERLAGARVALFIDYDGTLTPIVARPELAVLDDAGRKLLRELGRAMPVTIVSGRARADVQRLVDVPELYYAGSHGYDIAGPDGLGFEVAPESRALVASAYEHLHEQLAGVAGAIVEEKAFAVAVHYRQVAEHEVRRIEEAVDAEVAREPRLRKTGGKKVFEVRPAQDWDKGKAVLWLLERLGPGYVPIYIGDDVTDEDAFSALADRGVGIVVADVPRPTAARYALFDPHEVQLFLQSLQALQSSP